MFSCRYISSWVHYDFAAFLESVYHVQRTLSSYLLYPCLLHALYATICDDFSLGYALNANFVQSSPVRSGNGWSIHTASGNLERFHQKSIRVSSAHSDPSERRYFMAYTTTFSLNCGSTSGSFAVESSSRSLVSTSVFCQV